MVALALIADLLNWIPVVNWLITAITLPSFQFYFKMKGIRSGWSLAGNLAEVLPLVSVLPLITAGVVITIIMDRLSEKLAGGVLKPVLKANK